MAVFLWNADAESIIDVAIVTVAGKLAPVILLLTEWVQFLSPTVLRTDSTHLCKCHVIATLHSYNIG